MPSIKQLASNIIGAYKNYSFVRGDDFKWSASKQAITHPAITTSLDLQSLLHEIAHAELNHTGYNLDVELIGLEAEAWQKAAQLAKDFAVPIDDDAVEDHLDTYRLWLHKRSTCPRCGQNGLQAKTKIYSCINCRFLWRANEARLCSLRRSKLSVS